MLTVLPAAAPATRWRARQPMLLIIGTVLAVGALSTAYLLKSHEPSALHPARQATVTAAAFADAANSRCLADYQALVPIAQANATNPAVLIGLSIQALRTLAKDVSDLPHPADDDAALANIRQDSDTMAKFMQQNEAAFANPDPEALSDDLLARSQTLVLNMRQAYLALGLSQCVSPQIPGVPHA